MNHSWGNPEQKLNAKDTESKIRVHKLEYVTYTIAHFPVSAKVVVWEPEREVSFDWFSQLTIQFAERFVHSERMRILAK